MKQKKWWVSLLISVVVILALAGLALVGARLIGYELRTGSVITGVVAGIAAWFIGQVILRRSSKNKN